MPFYSNKTKVGCNYPPKIDLNMSGDRRVVSPISHGGTELEASRYRTRINKHGLMDIIKWRLSVKHELCKNTERIREARSDQRKSFKGLKSFKMAKALLVLLRAFALVLKSIYPEAAGLQTPQLIRCSWRLESLWTGDYLCLAGSSNWLMKRTPDRMQVTRTSSELMKIRNTRAHRRTERWIQTSV